MLWSPSIVDAICTAHFTSFLDLDLPQWCLIFIDLGFWKKTSFRTFSKTWWPFHIAIQVRILRFRKKLYHLAGRIFWHCIFESKILLNILKLHLWVKKGKWTATYSSWRNQLGNTIPVSSTRYWTLGMRLLKVFHPGFYPSKLTLRRYPINDMNCCTKMSKALQNIDIILPSRCHSTFSSILKIRKTNHLIKDNDRNYPFLLIKCPKTNYLLLQRNFFLFWISQIWVIRCVKLTFRPSLSWIHFQMLQIFKKKSIQHTLSIEFFNYLRFVSRTDNFWSIDSLKYGWQTRTPRLHFILSPLKPTACFVCPHHIGQLSNIPLLHKSKILKTYHFKSFNLQKSTWYTVKRNYFFILSDLAIIKIPSKQLKTME